MGSIKIDRIVRSKRRTVAIEVTREARLIVRAPLRTSSEDIDRFVEKKRIWILKKQEEAQQRLGRTAPKRFVSGEEFLFLGHSYKLKVIDDGMATLSFDNGFLLSHAHLEDARELFINWYRDQSYDRIGERLKHYSSVTGIHFNKFRITGAKKRWGSCNTKANIFFSWRLIMTPLPVIDYVVVHELVHIEEKSHSKVFWNRVGSILPDYRERRRWLKDNGHLLFL